MVREAWAVLLGCVLTCGAQERKANYQFHTPDYRIEMEVTFYPSYVGQKLAFHNSTEPGTVCYSGRGDSRACVERFVGALAIATYRVQRRSPEAPKAEQYREVVTLVEQSPGLADAPRYVREQRLRKGVGSDVQVFGYDEGAIPEEQRTAARSEWAGLWRVYRQELYLNDAREPFAVIEWKHTLGRIEVMRVTGR